MYDSYSIAIGPGIQNACSFTRPPRWVIDDLQFLMMEGYRVICVLYCSTSRAQNLTMINYRFRTRSEYAAGSAYILKVTYFINVCFGV